MMMDENNMEIVFNRWWCDAALTNRVFINKAVHRIFFIRHGYLSANVMVHKRRSRKSDKISEIASIG
jgi:hypothetical protein